MSSKFKLFIGYINTTSNVGKFHGVPIAAILDEAALWDKIQCFFHD